MRILRVEPHDPTILANTTTPGNWDGVYDVVFGADGMYKSTRGVEDPDASVGIVLELLAASAIGRPSNSMALFFENEVYYFCTKKDIFGEKGCLNGFAARSNTPPKAVRGGHLYKFAYREENQDNIALISKIAQEKL